MSYIGNLDKIFLRGQKTGNINILFILLDAARADRFSCYGHQRNTTPNIDAIGNRGAIFLNNFSQATDTLVSLPRMFFSRYFTKPIFRDYDTLPWSRYTRLELPLTIFKDFDNEQIILPEALSLNGYRTALFTELPFLTLETSFLADKFDETYDCDYESLVAPNGNGILPKVISWLEQNNKKKFFIYCHIMCPHIPYRINNESVKFLNDEMHESVEDCRKKFQDRQYSFTAKWGTDFTRILSKLYDGNLRYADSQVGILYNKLKSLNLENNTLIVITSDHGEELGDHGYYGHGLSAWDSNIHVPLIIAHPPKIPAGVKIKGMTESVDIMPTILDLCNVKLPRNKRMDGISLLKFIKHPNCSKKYIFSRHTIRSDKYKYIIDKDLFYNLKDDPQEKINLAGKGSSSLKNKLKLTCGKKMTPLLRRYNRANRSKLIDYPFYYLLSSFQISPEDLITKCEETKLGDIIGNEKYLKKPCVLNLYLYNCFLAFFPDAASSLRLVLSTNVPDGAYLISVLVETLKPISCVPEALGFQSRFGLDVPFMPASGIGQFQDYLGFNYIELGLVVIKQGRFYLEIDFVPPDKQVYIIRHIKFIPHGLQDKQSPQRFDKVNAEKRWECLKSLGYAQ